MALKLEGPEFYFDQKEGTYSFLVDTEDIGSLQRGLSSVDVQVIEAKECLYNSDTEKCIVYDVTVKGNKDNIRFATEANVKTLRPYKNFSR